MLYIKIKEPYHIKDKKQSALEKIFIKFIKNIMPLANPDFDDKISEVRFWLLEFEDEKSLPVREIGLDKNEEIIMKMPYNNNYGYWTDDNLVYQDFIWAFKYENITSDYFDHEWNKFLINKIPYTLLDLK